MIIKNEIISKRNSKTIKFRTEKPNTHGINNSDKSYKIKVKLRDSNKIKLQEDRNQML